MRVEIADWNGQPYVITSRNPELVGAWFAEHAAHLMTADARMEVRIRIWPQDHTEMDLIGQPDQALLTQEGLLKLAEVILDASKKLADLEAKR